MFTPRVAVIGAGMAGLAAAIDLSARGCAVTVLERAATPGGKMREVRVADSVMDAGPTVFTLRRVFDELFADAGDDLDRRIVLKPATLLARHAWDERGHLDLFADVGRSAQAIGEFAGRTEAAAFLRFAANARRIHDTLDESFMRAARPSPAGLVRRLGVTGLADLWNIKPFAMMWRAIGSYFSDPRLQQLFGRYATYCGSSPFQAPATLMLVAHVEQAGVWYVEGGMHRLVEQLAALATRNGALVRCSTEARAIDIRGGRAAAVETSDGERIEVDAVICNADNNALARGLFGADAARAVAPTAPAARSLSAITWNFVARTSGFELAHHSVFFSGDYRAEFDAVFGRRRVPAAPTVYVCAFDRQDDRRRGAEQAERILCLINAPADGDTHDYNAAEIETCRRGILERLNGCGLRMESLQGTPVWTTPSDFQRLFPATGGALYGPASHGWRASFTRPGSRSAIRGLYLAGGSTHPGPGVPMAATSGRLAAAALLTDCASTSASRTAVTSGGTSMRSATTAPRRSR